MSKNFKQNDTRWAKLGYPSGKDNMANSGCGCVACADLVVLNPKYANYTPIQVRKYMVSQGYAIKGKGTLFAGIVPTLEHFGLKAKWPDTMKELFNLLDKGPYDCGTLCMNAGTRGGVTWTTIAHFIAFTKYKKENGKHYFYIEDPGWRNNDGWFTYEDNMKGLVKHCYCAYVPNGKPSPEPEPKPTPSGKLKVDGVGGPETVKRLQEFLGCKSRDGVIGGQPISYKHLYPALKSVGFGSGGSQCITALQKWLGLSGPDGVLGKNTTSALQKKLRSLGYLPANESIDGVIGPKTMKALQEMLNNNGKKKGGTPTPTPTPDPKPTPGKETKVIDVSEFQDSINWSKVKAAGIDGAIIRCGFRGATTAKLQEDAMFLNHIKGAHKAGVKCGIYMFTEAINEAEGRAEADYAVAQWKKAGVPLYYPIAVDTEKVNIKGERARNLTKAQRTSAIKGFCERIKELGYTPMIYASTSWLDSKLDMSKLPYDVWVAQYYKECQYKGKYVMWQYTSTGKVAGVSGNVDLNHCYIEPKEANPPSDPKPEPQKKTIDELAKEVLDGKWGNGDERKKRLTEAGYDYDAVQKRVNEIIDASKTIIDKEMDACKVQADWMKNAAYKWESKPTIPKSKKKGTCVTYVACVLQRIGILKSGQYIWQNGKGYGTGKVYGTNDKMTTTYMDNKTFTACKSKLKKGDIVLCDDNKSGEAGSGGHIMIFSAFNKEGKPLVWDNTCAKTGKRRAYGKSRKILAIVRPK